MSFSRHVLVSPSSLATVESRSRMVVALEAMDLVVAQWWSLGKARERGHLEPVGAGARTVKGIR